MANENRRPTQKELLRALGRSLKENPSKPLPGVETPVDEVNLPGGVFYERTREGKIEYKRRQALAHTYEPGDELIVDYIFGRENGDVPNGSIVIFQGWPETQFREGSEELPYLKSNTGPGVYRFYTSVHVLYNNNIISLADVQVKIADENLAEQRIEKWGEKPLPGYSNYIPYVKVRDITD